MSTRIHFSYKESDVEWQKVKARLKPLAKDPRAKVGLVGARASQQQGKLTLAEIAAVHEYGSPKNHIPERSFIRSTLDANVSAYEQLLKPLIARLLEGKLTVKQLLGLWGAKAAADVKARLLKGAPIAPPLSKQTLDARQAAASAQASQAGKKRKKAVGSRPLVDTGQLVAALTWDVVMSGTAEGAAP